MLRSKSSVPETLLVNTRRTFDAKENTSSSNADTPMFAHTAIISTLAMSRASSETHSQIVSFYLGRILRRIKLSLKSRFWLMAICVTLMLMRATCLTRISLMLERHSFEKSCEFSSCWL